MTLAEDQNNKILLIGSNKVKALKPSKKLLKKLKIKKLNT
jgi:hypothetical protein